MILTAKMVRLTPAIVSSLLLAACSPGGGSEPDEPQVDNAGSPSAGDQPSAPILLETLGPRDRDDVELAGELGCGFYASRGGDPLFIGMGSVSDAESAEGMVKIDGRAVKLAMNGVGGYDRLVDGAQFAGGGLIVAVSVTGTEPLAEDPPVAGESPVHPARMHVARAGRELQIDGYYECGP